MKCPTCLRDIPDARLTPRELQMAEVIATSPDKFKEIATLAGTTEQVVKNIAHRIYQKLGVRGRQQLMEYWRYELFQVGLRTVRA